MHKFIFTRYIFFRIMTLLNQRYSILVDHLLSLSGDKFMVSFLGFTSLRMIIPENWWFYYFYIAWLLIIQQINKVISSPSLPYQSFQFLFDEVNSSINFWNGFLESRVYREQSIFLTRYGKVRIHLWDHYR